MQPTKLLIHTIIMKHLLALSLWLAVGWFASASAQQSLSYYEVPAAIKGAEHAYTPAYHDLNRRIAQLDGVKEFFYVHHNEAFVFAMPSQSQTKLHTLADLKPIDSKTFEDYRIYELAWKISSRPEHYQSIASDIPVSVADGSRVGLTDQIAQYLAAHPELVPRLQNSVVSY